jgi:hypothetical protein
MKKQEDRQMQVDVQRLGTISLPLYDLSYNLCRWRDKTLALVGRRGHLTSQQHGSNSVAFKLIDDL